MATSNVNDDIRITLIGAGTIGLPFAALHLLHLADPSQLTILDNRPDLEAHVHSGLPNYLPAEHHAAVKQIRLSKDLPSAVQDATIVQEQGPENFEFKQRIWSEVEKHAPADALLWSSTSGIPASAQAADMNDQSRLLVVHPYNPPHIMPLLEVVPSPKTSSAVVQRTLEFWRKIDREPILVKKECTGFVANRLAFALLRESIHLVNEGVVTVEELDRVVETSMGPRWAVAGPFKSYHAGGGKAGLKGFFENIGGTVQACWEALGEVWHDGRKEEEGRDGAEGWEERVFQQTEEAYGIVDTKKRDKVTRRVLEVVAEESANGSGRRRRD